METIMSTLALELAGAVAPAEERKVKSSLVSRLIKAREEQAKRRVLAYLADMGDARLRTLGFTDYDIKALRSGEMRLPK
jgi:hypothetical protein